MIWGRKWFRRGYGAWNSESFRQKRKIGKVKLNAEDNYALAA